MADKSVHLKDMFTFHPCDTPRGMDYYDLNCLTPAQQQRLNNHKIEVVRENQKYLYKNPEVRALLQIIIRKLLMERPTHDIPKFVANYLYYNWQKILDEVGSYVDSLTGKPVPKDDKPQLKEDKHVTLDEGGFDDRESSLSGKSSLEETTVENIARETIADIVERIVELAALQHKKVQTAETVEIIEDKHKRPSEEEDEDEALMFDLGLDFDLDFSAYHEEYDTNVGRSLSEDAIDK